jgi:hypothetical protein
MWIFWLLACSESNNDLVFTPEELCLPEETDDLVTLYGHVGDLNSDQEGLPTGVEALGITGASVWSCVNDQRVVSDAEGNFVVSVPNQEFVLFEVVKEGYLPARWIASPWVDGSQQVEGEIYANTIMTADFVTEVFGEVGVVWDDTKTLVVVDVVNPDHENPQGGWDLLGAVVEVTSPFEVSLVMDDDTRMLKEGNELSYHSDVIVVNVEPGPLSVVVTPPDGSTCHYPEYINGRPGELLHISIYCYWEE